MTKQEFDTLLNKFEKGQCSPEEVHFLEEIATSNFEKNSDIGSIFNKKELQSEENRMWNKLNEELFSIPKKRIFIISKTAIQTLVAACLFLITCISFYLYNPRIFNPQIVENRALETRNTTNLSQNITLPDGSRVVLEKNSSIIVQEDFGQNNRTVILKGKGFFQVVRNEKKPFLVRMGNLVTEVLGTSFRVASDNQNKSIEVAVVSGKVSVYENSKKGVTKKMNGVVLTPNLKAIYNTENQTIQESIVENPILIHSNIQKSDFMFDEIRFGILRDRFKYFYGLDIIFVNRDIEKCLFTGDLSGLNLYKQLDVACSSINAKYEIRGSTIFIDGKSCN
ncbi:FecR family protein [Aquirufa sp. OSTEICH-129A]